MISTHTASIREHRWTGTATLPLLSAVHWGNFQTKVETSRYVRLPSLTQLHAQDGSPCVCDPPPPEHSSRAQSSGWAVAPLWVVTEQHQVVLWLREPQPPP